MKCDSTVAYTPTHTHQVTYWSIVSTVHPVLAQLREDKERITDVVVEYVGGENYSTQVQENIVKHLKKKNKQ
jgi:GTP cyclohydrolase III